MSQSPSLRGSGRFWKSMPPPSGGGATSQSPSLRGSGRFPFSSDRKNSHSWCLNPLHCGAVVASFGPPHGGGAGRGLNPLHCGAVVASPGAVDRRADKQPVSIPFIAGQWSLLLLPETPPAFGGVSIPFIAGQWSLPAARGVAPGRVPGFQSPSLRGSGRFSLALAVVSRPAPLVSIPFIAGQWSLRARRGGSPRAPRRFNPLHCGAVVASIGHPLPADAPDEFQSPSLRGSGRFLGEGLITHLESSFNPLHCGAVVASS